jgi:MFS family permease
MLDRRTRIALVAMSLAVFVIANDITSLSVALPQIERTFHVDVETVQWVMNAYTLVFGVWIVTGGRLSDMFGRRRTFFAGISIFAVFSAPRSSGLELRCADRCTRRDGRRGGPDLALGRGPHLQSGPA